MTSNVRETSIDCLHRAVSCVTKSVFNFPEYRSFENVIRKEVLVHRLAVKPCDSRSGLEAAIWIGTARKVFARRIYDNQVRRYLDLPMQCGHGALHQETVGIPV
ncbi:hypothetical protein DM82_1102 [Burkholderia oklahomensis]|uniref:Uncharacterized protein n=1 Tax=Burkholderia oklahomensis TaxID=342113 RepID=A0AAI8FLN5_9BURK|nr:hypothetical protein DM82_1102 [Burkholderia oklahomensis]